MQTHAPWYECSVTGSIAEHQTGALLERICGLTGAAATLLAHASLATAALVEHEIVFRHRRAPKSGAAFAGGSGSLRAVALAADFSNTQPRALALSDRKWSLRFVASPQPPKPGQFVSIRAIYDAPIVRGDVFQFIDLLDYEMAFEFVRKGYRFHSGSLCITVSCIYKLEEKHKMGSMKPLDEAGTWLVELVSDRTRTENIPAASEAIAAFAKNLRGLVDMTVVDVNKYAFVSSERK